MEIAGTRLGGEFAIPPVIDLVAIILFAITGAFTAAKRNYDWIGVMAIAFVTGCGGGLIRDVLLNERPAILENELYLLAIILAVVLSTVFSQLLAKIRWIFTVADALGLTMYAVFGTNKSLINGLPISSAILVGTLNAIGGGILRDILTRDEARILKPGQLYAAVAFLSSALFAVFYSLVPLPTAASGAIVVLIGFICRLIVQKYNLQTRPLRPRGFESDHW